MHVSNVLVSGPAAAEHQLMTTLGAVPVKVCKSFHALIMGYESLLVSLEKGRRKVAGYASHLDIHIAPFDIISKAEENA